MDPAGADADRHYAIIMTAIIEDRADSSQAPPSVYRVLAGTGRFFRESYYFRENGAVWACQRAGDRYTGDRTVLVLRCQSGVRCEEPAG